MNCFIYLKHFLSDFDDLLLFSLVFFHTCSIIFLLLNCQFMKIFRETRLWNLRRLINLIYNKIVRNYWWCESRRFDNIMRDLEKNSSRDFAVWLYEFIYFHILIFRAKSLSSSIQKWKLFELRINMMILKKILSSFIVEEKNSIFKNNINLFRISNAFRFKNKKNSYLNEEQKIRSEMRNIITFMLEEIKSRMRDIVISLKRIELWNVEMLLYFFEKSIVNESRFSNACNRIHNC
jgi:hypothetical protein